MEKLTFDPVIELAKLLNVPTGYFTVFYVLVIAVFLVVILLKGLALWRASRNGQRVWFWVLLFVNTLGVLEIIYLLAVKEDKECCGKCDHEHTDHKHE